MNSHFRPSIKWWHNWLRETTSHSYKILVSIDRIDYMSFFATKVLISRVLVGLSSQLGLGFLPICPFWLNWLGYMPFFEPNVLICRVLVKVSSHLGLGLLAYITRLATFFIKGDLGLGFLTYIRRLDICWETMRVFVFFLFVSVHVHVYVCTCVFTIWAPWEECQCLEIYERARDAEELESRKAPAARWQVQVTRTTSNGAIDNQCLC